MIENTQWVEGAHDAFHQSLDSHNYEEAKRIIKTVFDAGFDKEAVVMNQELLEVPVHQFAVPTIYA